MSNNIEKTDKKDNGLFAQAKVAHNVALEVGNDLIDLTLKSGAATQRIIGKVLNGGVTIFGMQQDLALTALEQVAEKVTSNDQLKKLVEVPVDYFNRFKKTAEETTATLKETSGNIKVTLAEAATDVKEEVVEAATKVSADLHVTETVADVKEEVATAVAKLKRKVVAKVEVVADKVEEVAEAVTDKAENMTDKVEEVAETVTDKVNEVAEEVEEVAEEVEAKTVAVLETDDLTKIKGIGPKSATILAATDYNSFEKIAAANVEELKAVLEAGGAASLNPEPWIEQAKLIIA